MKQFHWNVLIINQTFSCSKDLIQSASETLIQSFKNPIFKFDLFGKFSNHAKRQRNARAKTLVLRYAASYMQAPLYLNKKREIFYKSSKTTKAKIVLPQSVLSQVQNSTA